MARLGGITLASPSSRSEQILNLRSFCQAIVIGLVIAPSHVTVGLRVQSPIAVLHN
eukprot:c33382_g1_i1 orf=2-169(-)